MAKVGRPNILPSHILDAFIYKAFETESLKIQFAESGQAYHAMFKLRQRTAQIRREHEETGANRELKIIMDQLSISVDKPTNTLHMYKTVSSSFLKQMTEFLGGEDNIPTITKSQSEESERLVNEALKELQK